MDANSNRQTTIVTSEHVKLELTTAGIGSRAVALLLDYLLIVALFCLFWLFGGMLFILFGGDWNDLLLDYVFAFLTILLALLIGAYFIIMEYYRAGQTFGKRWTGLRVVQENGQPVTFLSAVIRNFFRLIDSLPFFYFIGIVWMFFHSKDKRLGDVAAGTVVVRDVQHARERRKLRAKKWIQRFKANRSVNMQLPEHVEKKLEREDWQLLQAYIERLPSLHKSKRKELAQRMAGHFCEKLELDQALMERPVSFLISLYEKGYEDWSI
ncbi:RDD family protein [Halalkalibacterium halodurans]|jgi:uncharacterized RDD family membrane protein YckC|uniref:RDD domain-containing protein n=1 Tax=Halalkalibacterium halodurans TaxID=86665 RepID=A0A0M0KBN4_ALKHA|nr:RDD family protein [Halalkalibacterium halodurans]MED4163712.1 RDD family protein [Halalkalibacterium halodurans]TPE70078.1 RDD family protein [Halalkalibacterium halodurans]